MRILLVTLCVLLLVLSATPSTNVAVGNWVWKLEDTSTEYYVFLDAYYNGGSSDAFDGFFYTFLDPAGSIYPASGGVTSADLIYSEPSGEFKVFKHQLPNPYLGAIITTTARIDDGPVSWGSVFQEFYNPGATPVSLYLNSLKGGSTYGDNRGSDGNTIFIATSSGDNAFTQADSWSVSYQASGGHDPVEITAFGEAGLLDYLKEYNGDDNIHWTHTITIPPQKTVGFLRAVGLVNYYYAGAFIPGAKVVAQNAAVAAVNSATTFYTYQNPLGNRLLSHLSAPQLLSVVNWDFLSAGVGGDPHGVHFDGTLFELPGSPAIYCLFADDRHQVNLKVARSGFVTQVVVISHLHGIRVSAEIDEFDNIEYLVDDRQIGVPEMFDIIETRVAPLKFRSDPLNQLERYHQSALMIRNLVTIVGGIHPTLGGFFNVAVHTRPNHSTHPTLLQLPSHPLRDVGFSVAVIPRIDFTF